MFANSFTVIIVLILLAIERKQPMSSDSQSRNSEPGPQRADLFLQFRHKVQASELLSAATEKLAQALGFTGRLTIVLQNGQVLKSGYEEGYFRRKDDWSS